MTVVGGSTQTFSGHAQGRSAKLTVQKEVCVRIPQATYEFCKKSAWIS